MPLEIAFPPTMGSVLAQRSLELSPRSTDWNLASGDFSDEDFGDGDGSDYEGML